MKSFKIKPKDFYSEVSDVVVKLYSVYIHQEQSIEYLHNIHTIVNSTLECIKNPTVSKFRKIKRLVRNAVHENNRSDIAC